MRISSSFPVLLWGALASGLWACGAQDPDTGGVNPEIASGGSRGKAGSPGAGGSAAGGAGGSVATPPAPSGGSAGSSSSGSGGAAGAAPSGSGGAPAEVDAGPGPAPVPSSDGGAPPPAPSAEGAPYGCTNCKRLFNGTNLDGWETVAGAWEVKPGGILASTGKPNDIYTKEDFGDSRIFFQVRQISGSHKPCTVLFGTRPAAGAAPKRGLGGAQFQPPNGSSWNYGIGGKFTGHPHPPFDVKAWHQCEVLIKEAGSFRAACCPMGPTPCKSVEVLSWAGPSKKAPFDIMMHNDKLFDEYKEIWIEQMPAVDGFLSQK